MGNEAMRRRAIVLIALKQNLAVLDQQQAGYALARKKIIERMRLISELVLELRFAGGFGKRQR